MRDTAHLNRQRHTICASTHSYSPLASDALPPLGVLSKACPPGVLAAANFEEPSGNCKTKGDKKKGQKKGTKAIMDEADRAELSECELE